MVRPPALSATPRRRRLPRVSSFAPLATSEARVLVLGSMPGVASLAAGEYYAHPRNQFWPLMGQLCGALPALPYARRCQQLTSAGGALWDVFDNCVRSGSADGAIDLATAQLNDIIGFVRAHRQLERILCNGKLAQQSLQRHFDAALAAEFPRLRVYSVPSTSPAHASLDLARKLTLWRAAWPDPGALKR